MTLKSKLCQIFFTLNIFFFMNTDLLFWAGNPKLRISSQRHFHFLLLSTSRKGKLISAVLCPRIENDMSVEISAREQHFQVSTIRTFPSTVNSLPLVSLFFSARERAEFYNFVIWLVLGVANPPSPPTPTPLFHTRTHTLTLAACDICRVMSFVIYKYPFFSGWTACLKPCSLFTSSRVHLHQANYSSIFLLLLLLKLNFG